MPWAPDYVDVALLKSYLRIDDAADDALLAPWVTAASRNVDSFCNRQFGRVDDAETREYPGRYVTGVGYVYDLDDVPDRAGMVVTTAAGVLLTDYRLGPVNAAQKGRPYERLLGGSGGALTISGVRWGWAAVPSSVKTGLMLMGARLAARRDSPFGVAGSPSEGSEIRLLSKLDPDMITVLRPFRRNWWAR